MKYDIIVIGSGPGGYIAAGPEPITMISYFMLNFVDLLIENFKI